jgi:hypothetical protein
VVAPTLGSGTPGHLVVVFNEDGVPVWWYRTVGTPTDAKAFPDGTVGWTQTENPPEIRDLDGSLVRTVQTVGIGTDTHDLQLLPDGDVLLLAYSPREHVDLSEYGGSADATVLDGVAQRVAPDGHLVWSWNSKDHIGLAETGRWYSLAQSTTPTGQRDIVHINAIEPVGDEYALISFRHLDAVYKINVVTGEIVWKLGGTTTSKSLIVLDDPHGSYPLGGQHDVRLQPDGTITIHDNRTELGEPPRAVRYSIDEGAKTATLLEEVTDPEAPASVCCGSARRSADGSWLMSWGGRPLVTEFNAARERTFKLNFGPTLFSYRAIPVPDGTESAEDFRAGMDSMFPR